MGICSPVTTNFLQENFHSPMEIHRPYPAQCLLCHTYHHLSLTFPTCNFSTLEDISNYEKVHLAAVAQCASICTSRLQHVLAEWFLCLRKSECENWKSKKWFHHIEAVKGLEKMQEYEYINMNWVFPTFSLPSFSVPSSLYLHSPPPRQHHLSSGLMLIPVRGHLLTDTVLEAESLIPSMAF